MTGNYDSANQIQYPVLAAHGKDDFTVSYKQSKLLIQELKKADVEYETFFKYHEGHGFAEEEHRVEFYKNVEKFLFRLMPVK